MRELRKQLGRYGVVVSHEEAVMDGKGKYGGWERVLGMRWFGRGGLCTEGWDDIIKDMYIAICWM